MVEAEKKEILAINNSYHSAELGEIAKAMAKARGEYKRIEHNRNNPFFKSKYTDLDAIFQAVGPALENNGIWFVQNEQMNPDYTISLHTKLVHTSGQWIESRTLIRPPKSDVQSYGATLSYHKRYSAETILGFTSSENPLDDDGESNRVSHNGPINGRGETITADQYKDLEEEIGEYLDLAKEIMAKMNIVTLWDMPKEKYRPAMKWLQDRVALKNQGVKGA